MQMTLSEIITAVLSAVALIISLYTFYVTKIKTFSGKVFPSSRLVLTWVFEGDIEVPCIYLICQYINSGARIGKIDDLILEMKNIDGGGEFTYIGFLIAERKVDAFVEVDDPEQHLDDFYTIWLKSEENRNVHVFFKSQQNEVNLIDNCVYKINLWYSGDNVRKFIWRNFKFLKWNSSPSCYSFILSKAELESWKRHEIVKLEAREINDNRKEVFRV